MKMLQLCLQTFLLFPSEVNQGEHILRLIGKQEAEARHRQMSVMSSSMYAGRNIKVSD